MCHVKPKSNYVSFSEKIKKAASHLDCDSLEHRLFRHWNNGTFTVSETQRLDNLICLKRNEIQDKLIADSPFKSTVLGTPITQPSKNDRDTIRDIYLQANQK